MTAVLVDVDLPVIELVDGMPGFPGLTKFALVRLDDEGVLCAMRSLEEPGLRFLVVPPALFFPDYAPEIDDTTANELELRSADDALVLVVVNPGDSVDHATANLLAPVVINLHTHKGNQIVLNEDLPVRAPLLGA